MRTPDQTTNAVPAIRHRGPNLGAVAVVFTLLKVASLFPVTIFGIAVGFRPPYFPPDTASPEQVVSYFATHSTVVLIPAFLQFGSAIPLGIFTAAIASQIRFLGLRAAGVNIALFGGLAAAFDSSASAFTLWGTCTTWNCKMSRWWARCIIWPSRSVGVGYAVPIGLLMAGVSVTAGITRLLPKWIVVLGLFLAVVGELSWLTMITTKLALLVPLTRFPGFIWMITAGFALTMVHKKTPQSRVMGAAA